MPTYQYACKNPDCGNRFELVQSFTDPAASECPVCHQDVRKVYGSVGVVFKGSGFYRNDSRSASVTSESGGSSSSESKSSDSKSSESTSSDSKTSDSKPSSNGTSSTSGNSSATKAGSSTPSKPAAASA